MSEEHYSQSNLSREKKKAQFSETGPHKKKVSPVLVIALVALVGIGGYLVMSNVNDTPASNAQATSKSKFQNSSASGVENVAIPLSDISSTARFFEYAASDNRTVRFFAIKSSDGVYRAALDACDVCYAAKQGYYQEGDNMVCRKCGKLFPSALVNEVTGGCNPIGLPRTVEGNQLVIKTSELENRKTYF